MAIERPASHRPEQPRFVSIPRYFSGPGTLTESLTVPVDALTWNGQTTLSDEDRYSF
ncbi:MAG: hypothetical protein GY703_13675 [Gammaproteobacteria bacterium]|nr:hypothetical protein [Gammaproteobacteria bacterium]